MEDDIDIEEHDVLDNPRIKSIFPDLSRVKIEIPDEDDALVEGSKPPVDWDALKMEALTSNTVVDLENWGPTLEASPCYCNSCSILFPTVNALDAHKMISHSYLVAMDLSPKNTARKSTVPSKYCNHCSKTFPDDTSLIKHLYELLPLNFPVKEEPEDTETVKPKKIAAQLPKKLKSSTPVPRKIKVEPKEEVEQTSEVPKRKICFKLPRDGKFFASSSLVPRGTLFQCNICQIGFISCFAALQHSKYCEKALAFDKCGVCKRKIRKKDSAIHSLQHQTNDKLKIYTVNKNMYDKVLCKCPKCLSCFDELGFWAHYGKCKKSERKSTRCPDCDLHIASTRYQLHRIKHASKKLSKKELIVIEFFDHSAKGTIDMRKTAKEFKKKFREKIKRTRQGADVVIYPHDIPLYYCDVCGCCQYKLSYKGHVNGMCRTYKSKKYCEKCGLCFSAKGITSHRRLHANRSFQLKDIKIFNLSSGQVMEPPLPEMYRCEKCEKHFLYYRNVRFHKCKQEKFVTCKVCSKKFNIQAYKIHKKFHGVDELIPELLKKYNLIQTTWNVLFMCQACEIVNMTYDAAVTHSQESTSLTEKNKYFCMNCNKFMDGPTVSSHIANNCAKNNDIVCELCHEQFQSLTQLLDHDGDHEKLSQMFTVISFNNECDKAFNSHLKMLESKTPYQRKKLKQEVPLSKLRELLLKDANAKKAFKLYKCSNCSTCVSLKSSVNRHNCVPEGERKFCKTCEQYFSVKKFQVHMEAHRKRPDIRKGMFHVVNFAGKNKLKDEVTAKVYHCNCGLHFTSMKTVENHLDVCDKNLKVSKEKCSKCDLVFPTDLLVTHIINHHSKETKIDIVNVAKLNYFKCFKCSNIFVDMPSFNGHSLNCDAKNGVKCTNCKLTFDKRSLPKHMVDCVNKSNVTYIKKIVTIKKIVKESTVYRCEECDLNYLARNTFKYHTIEANHKHKEPIPCDVCGLKFTNCSYQKHIKIHSVPNEDYKIKVLNGLTRQFYFMTGSNKVDNEPWSPKKRKLKTNTNDDDSPTLSKVQKIDENVPKIRKSRSRGDESLTSNDEEMIIVDENVTIEKSDKSFENTSKSRRSRSNLDVPSNLKDGEDFTPEQSPSARKVDQNAQKSRPSRSKIDEPSTSRELIGPDHPDHAESDISLDGSGISNKVISKLHIHKYTATLYKCIFCNQHYMKDTSFDYHIKHHKKLSETINHKCDTCGLEFSKHTLPRHQFVHHKKMDLKLEDFKILTESTYSPDAEIRTMMAHLQAKDGIPNLETTTDSAQNDNLDESLEYIDVENTESEESNENMIYFKCSECNVCFVDEKMCFEHTNKHEIMDPKMYIQCKICEFQFMIDALKEHMTEHHKDDFKIDGLIIHEYLPQVGTEPKIQTYKAIDKVQSRLISTTTDVGIS
ncbi:hypothetical protein HF086_009798 [Spodoptera exigua]|uniref:C2H2-type domain-containing protein n=1 Tax=Spodoptera exigua TaxID=7107 RepID=A0A922S8F0_SPOEX|nr:hypothetical protein HF086_009798 [Spodoptera exigua]